MTTVHRAAIAVGFVPQPSESADPADGRFAPEAVGREHARGESLNAQSALKSFACDRTTRRAGWRRIPHARTPRQSMPKTLEQRIARRPEETS
jgi:hypothetical protein